MGEIFEAYAALNKSLKLGLNENQILSMEASFKSEYARRANFPKEMVNSRAKLSEGWEFVTTLVPRDAKMPRKKLLELGKVVVENPTIGASKTLVSKTLDVRKAGLLKKPVVRQTAVKKLLKPRRPTIKGR